MTDSSATTDSVTCLGRTCLHWGTDGELMALDLTLVMQRLARVDPELMTSPDLSSGSRHGGVTTPSGVAPAGDSDAPFIQD